MYIFKNAYKLCIGNIWKMYILYVYKMYDGIYIYLIYIVLNIYLMYKKYALDVYFLKCI